MSIRRGNPLQNSSNATKNFKVAQHPHTKNIQKNKSQVSITDESRDRNNSLPNSRASMKTFSSLAILACLAYQASSLPLATTSDVEKREAEAAPLLYGLVKREEAEEAETPAPLYYFYGKREVTEEEETPSPLYYFYGKREEAEEGETPSPLYYFYGKREEAEEGETPSPLYYFYGKREVTEKREESEESETPSPLYYFYGKREEAEEGETPSPLYYFYGKREE
jgi:hypothetical protein